MNSATKAVEHRAAYEARLVATLDTALAAASRRGSYTRDELVRLLNDVVATVREPELVGPVLGAVDRVLERCTGQAIVDRGFVVDALLDVRLVVTSAAGPEMRSPRHDGRVP